MADPGDEVVFSLPPWFLYESLALEAGLVPVKVRIDPDTFDLDLAAIEAAITPRTRVVIVNTPNNPTGRIYPESTLRALADLLEDASARNGRRIYLISDEPYNRLVFDGARFVSPAQFYPYTLLCYSYGKTLLSPGQRLGYLALPPSMPDDVADAVIEAVESVQIAAGWLFPNNVMQYATPRLEELSIDVAHLQAKRDRMVEALRGIGYDVATPEGDLLPLPAVPAARRRGVRAAAGRPRGARHARSDLRDARLLPDLPHRHDGHDRGEPAAVRRSPGPEPWRLTPRRSTPPDDIGFRPCPPCVNASPTSACPSSTP